MNNLLDLLHKVAFRTNLVHLYHWTMKGLSAGLLFALVILVFGRFAPVSYLGLTASVMIVAGGAIGVLIGWLTKKTKLDTARKIDREYANDAIVTALEADNSAALSIFASLQQEQAVRLLREYMTTLRKRIPFFYRRTSIIHSLANIVAVMTVLLLLFVPNAQAELAKKLAEEQQAVTEAAQSIDSIMNELDEYEIANSDREYMKRILQELQDELLSNRELTQSSLKKLEQALQAMQALEEREQSSEFELLNEMMKDSSLRQLAQNLKKEQKGHSEVLAAIEQMSKEERKALAEKLAQLALKSDQNMSELLKSLSEQLDDAANDSESLAKGLEQLRESLNESRLAEQASEAAKQINEQLQQSLSNLANQLPTNEQAAEQLQRIVEQLKKEASMENSSQAGNQEENIDESSNHSDNTATDDDHGNENPGSEEQATSEGEGSSAASPGANGAGVDASSGSGGASQQGSGSVDGGFSTGQGAGTGSSPQQMITTPRKYKGTSEPTLDDAETTGGEVLTGGEAQVSEGESKHYTEAYGEYEAAAKDSLARSTLPASLQDKVRAYFESLQ